ncbi:MAG TPA: hypothetical protein VIW92_10255 [Thermoanaerobaculia bacterium]
MSAKFSMEELLAHFEAQMAFHKRQEAQHAEQEALHKEQKELHAAEYETVARNFEAFKATAGVAFGIAKRMASVSEMSLQELPPGQPVVRSRLVAKVVEQYPQGEVFGARKLAAEVNRRFGKAMKKPANPQLVSAALRRMLANGQVRRVREGAGQQEALYTRA